MISDGFEWSWFPVKPFGIHEIFMRIIKIMYHTISSSLIYTYRLKFEREGNEKKFGEDGKQAKQLGFCFEKKSSPLSSISW